MNRYRHLGITLLAGALLLGGFASTAQALTNACVQIDNQASLTYSVGGVTQPVIQSDGDGGTAGAQFTSFFVATKVDLTVAQQNSPVTATGADQVMTFLITNTGNDQQRYSLRLWGAANGYDYDGTASYVDNFNMASVRVYTDNDNNYANGTLAEISAAAATDGSHLGYTDPINGNNGSVYVHVVANVPAGQVSGDDAVYALQALTHQIVGRQGGNNAAAATDGGETDESAETANGCGSAVVLADNQVTGTGPGGAGPGGVTDSDRNGDSFAVGVYTVATANISVTKSYAVIDDYVNTAAPYRAIPGARVRYTVSITNSTATPATSLELVDQIPANTDFVVGSVVMPVGADDDYSNDNQTTWTYAPSAVAPSIVDATVSHIRIDTFNLGANSTETITFDVLIE